MWTNNYLRTNDSFELVLLMDLIELFKEVLDLFIKPQVTNHSKYVNKFDQRIIFDKPIIFHSLKRTISKELLPL